jgi:hypothetical protein
MRQELTLEWRILGGNAQEALQSIKRMDDPDTLRKLLHHEERHYRRKSVKRGLEARLRKGVKERQEDQELASVVEARKDQPEVEVAIDDLKTQ